MLDNATIPHNSITIIIIIHILKQCRPNYRYSKGWNLVTFSPLQHTGHRITNCHFSLNASVEGARNASITAFTEVPLLISQVVNTANHRLQKPWDLLTILFGGFLFLLGWKKHEVWGCLAQFTFVSFGVGVVWGFHWLRKHGRPSVQAVIVLDGCRQTITF